MKQKLCKILCIYPMPMSYGKVIRISDRTIDLLEKLRQRFENPDQCINRILENHFEKYFPEKNKAPKITITELNDDGTVRQLV